MRAPHLGRAWLARCPRQWNGPWRVRRSARVYPSRNPHYSSLLPFRFDVHDQTLTRSDLVMLVQAVPGFELRHRDLELAGNAEYCVAAAHGVEHSAAGFHSLIPKAPRARLDDQALSLHERIRR